MKLRHDSVLLRAVCASAACVLLIAGCNKTGTNTAEFNPQPSNNTTATAPTTSSDTNANTTDTSRAEAVAADSSKQSDKSSVGTAIDDTIVTTRVRSALLADPDIKSFEPKVETRKGEVQISGFLDSQKQIDRALEIARGIEGVKSVDNKMSLKSGDRTIGAKVDDGITTTRVKSALIADPMTKSFDISVVTNQGVVQLSGFADNQTQINRAMQIAGNVEGVSNVSNHMSIKQ